MPRKDFQRDLSRAATEHFPGLSYIKGGDHDGSISFAYTASSGVKIEFQAIVSGKENSSS